jgi:uncharacterized protein YycO
MPVLKVKNNGVWEVIGSPIDVDPVVDELQIKVDELQNKVNEVENTIEDSENEIIAYVDEKFAAVPEFDPTEIQSAIDENISAIADNSNAIAEIQGDYLTSADRDQLQGEISAVSERIDTIPEFDPTELQNAIDANTEAIDRKVEKVEGMGLSENNYTTVEKGKLATVDDNANFYEHPIHTSYTQGLYKVKIDSEGHVSEASLVEKEDIVTFVEKNDILTLGIPDKDVIDEEISDLNDRVDSIDASINDINEALDNVTETFEKYKESNDATVSENADGVLRNSEKIAEIKGDYLKKTDKTELQDSITQVTKKADDNAADIKILKEDGEGSIKHSIDTAFNEFAAKISDNGLVDTYKELIDYVDKHGPEFATLVGEVGVINGNVGKVAEDLAGYQEDVSEQFDEVNTAILEHVHEDDKAAIADLQELVGETSVSEQIDDAIANTTVEVGSVAYRNAYKIKVTVNGVLAEGPGMSLVRYDTNQTGLTDEQKQQARTNIGAVSYKDIYVQDEEPTDTPHGTLWIDLDDDLETWTWGDY